MSTSPANARKLKEDIDMENDHKHNHNTLPGQSNDTNETGGKQDFIEKRNESQEMIPAHQEEEAPPLPPRNKLSFTLVVLAVLSSIFLFALDNTIVADIQPKIIADLGGIEKLPWISVAFALGAVSTNLIWGKLCSEFDPKFIFLAAVLLFEVGSALCGAAPNINALIVGRAICGVGGLGIYTGSINLISMITTEVERPLYVSFTGLTWGLGTVLGPILGGAFSDSAATWRWSFYINLCVGGVCAPIYILLVPASPTPRLSVRERISKLDFAGGILVIGAFVSGTMAISFGGALYNWQSGKIIGLFVCSAVLWILFILQQAYEILTTPDTQLFPKRFLHDWEMRILFIQAGCSSAFIYIPIYFIPLFFQFVRSNSALLAGVHLLPFIFILIFFVVLNGGMLGKFGFYMPWFLGGGLMAAIGGALLLTLDINSTNARVYGSSIITAVGAGATVQAPHPVAQAKVTAKYNKALVPSAVAFIVCAQITGLVVSLSITNSIFINEATNKISNILPGISRSQVQQGISGADGAFFTTLSSDQRTRVLSAIIASLDKAYILVIVAGALMVILSIFMKRDKLQLA